MIVPWIIGAIALGRCFDIFQMSTTSFYAFDDTDINSHTEVTPSKKTESRYQVIEKSSDVISFLNLDLEFALKVKSNSMRLPGVYTFLSNTVDRSKTIEILFYVYHEVETQSFPPSVKQATNWQDRPQSQVGSHYIQGMKYGGELLISYKITASDIKYFKDVKSAVETHVGSSGDIDASLPEKLQHLDDAIQGKAFSSYQFTASGTQFPNPQSLQAGIQLALRYPQEIEKFNGGKGAPLRLILEDLHTIKSSYKPYKRNEALVPILKEVNDKFDDIVAAKEKYEQFDRDHGATIWTDEQEKMINGFYRQLKKAEGATRLAIRRLDATGSEHQFDETFAAYGEGENKYQHDLQKLIDTLLQH